MKKLLLAATILTSAAGAASAADLPYKAPRAPFVPVASWTGCYIGGHIGGGAAWTQNTVTTSTGTNGFPDFGVGQGYSQPASGFIGGGQLGCNYQMGRYVVGIEGTYSASGIKRDYNSVFGVADDVYTNKVTDIATVVGRLAWRSTHGSSTRRPATPRPRPSSASSTPSRPPPAPAARPTGTTVSPSAAASSTC
jgi:outer membrane immunogenic protein